MRRTTIELEFLAKEGVTEEQLQALAKGVLVTVVYKLNDELISLTDGDIGCQWIRAGNDVCVDVPQTGQKLAFVFEDEETE